MHMLHVCFIPFACGGASHECMSHQNYHKDPNMVLVSAGVFLGEVHANSFMSCGVVCVCCVCTVYTNVREIQPINNSILRDSSIALISPPHIGLHLAWSPECNPRKAVAVKNKNLPPNFQPRPTSFVHAVSSTRAHTTGIQHIANSCIPPHLFFPSHQLVQLGAHLFSNRILNNCRAQKSIAPFSPVSYYSSVERSACGRVIHLVRRG